MLPFSRRNAFSVVALLPLATSLTTSACSKPDSQTTATSPSASASVASAAPSASVVSLPATFDRHYVGTIDGSDAIAMHLKRAGAVLSGEYSYVGKGGGSLALNGTLSPDDTFELTEKNGNVTTGKLAGAFVATGLAGTWTDPKGARALKLAATEGPAEAPHGSTTLSPHLPNGKPLVASDALDSPLEMGAPAKTDTRIAKTCADIDANVNAGYFGYTANDQNLVGLKQNECLARSVFKKAATSKSSFLSGFHLDVDQADHLPASVAIGVSQEAQAKIVKLEAQKKTWRDAQPKLKFVSGTAAKASYTDDVKDDIHVTVLAFADFDGDGLEDMILQSTTQGNGGSTIFPNDPLILTRLTDGGPIALVRRITK